VAGLHALARLQLARGQRVDHQVPHRGQRRGKAALEDILHGALGKARPLPVQIMVVRDGADARCLDIVGQRHAQRNLHRYGHGVLDKEHVDGIAPHIGRDGVLQAQRHGFDARAQVGGRGAHKGLVVDAARLGPLKVHLGHQHARRRVGVELAGAVKDAMAVRLQDAGDLGRLERDAIGAGQPSRDEPDVHAATSLSHRTP